MIIEKFKFELLLYLKYLSYSHGERLFWKLQLLTLKWGMVHVFKMKDAEMASTNVNQEFCPSNICPSNINVTKNWTFEILNFLYSTPCVGWIGIILCKNIFRFVNLCRLNSQICPNVHPTYLYFRFHSLVNYRSYRKVWPLILKPWK